MYLMVEPRLVGSFHQSTTASCDHANALCELRRDLYGNLQRQLVAAPGTFTFDFTATIEAAPTASLTPEATEQLPQQLPPEVMIYTLPSRYCQSDLLTRMARLEFGHLPPGGTRVLAISQWVRPTRRLRLRHDRLPDFGLRHGHPGESASAVISPTWSLPLSGTGYSRSICLRLRPWPQAARLPRLRPGLPGRSLAQCRCDVRDDSSSAHPHRRRSRCRNITLTTIWGMSTVIEQAVEVRVVET